MRTHYTVTRYCHNLFCEKFDEPVELRVTRATRSEPEEWKDDPECKGCRGNLDGEYNEYQYDEDFYLPADYKG